jgi:catechol-2,3-dioxygenase
MTQVKVVSIAHVALRTEAIREMEEYYTAVLGLWECGRDADGTLHLTAGGNGADVELIPSDVAGLDHVAFRLSAGSRIEEVSEALGVDAQPWGRSDPGSAASLGLSDPEGNLIQLIVPDDVISDVQPGSGIRPRKLGHLATRVSDSATIRAFYETKLGFRFSDANESGVVFLRCNADHHAVNIIEASRPGQTHHIAFELEDDFGHVQRAGDHLAVHGIPLLWGPGRHGPGHSIFTYHHDPDGHVIELFTQLDRMSDEGQGYFDPRSWHTTRPQRPRVWRAEDRAVGGMVPPRPPGFWA